MAGERLPAVLPVVLYNDTEPWTAAPEMRVLITPVGRCLAPYQPAQRYCLLDLRRLPAEDLPYRNLPGTLHGYHPWQPSRASVSGATTRLCAANPQAPLSPVGRPRNNVSW